ncbi:MAG: CatB-related O-acetyltransferase [Dehalococcoidia bacterium]|nr:CatB-related O-acetyltransferase [Dehalococcoidia bacterium]
MKIVGQIMARLSQVALNLSVTLNPVSKYRRRPPASRRIRYLKDVMKRSDVEVGEYTYGDLTVYTWAGFVHSDSWARVRIGKFCSIAPCVIQLRGDHRMDYVSTYPFKAFLDDWPTAEEIEWGDAEAVNPGDVVIGNDVWIGNNATILGGVRIGDGAVVGTNSVVASDVEPYAIVAGNPARVIRKRFDDETIRKLLEIRWWDWPHDKIAANLQIICSPNVQRLFELSQR